jgi:hypothetical protein
MEIPTWLAPTIAVLLWCVWFLWAVNWSKAWPVLASGAWAPVVLLMLVGAMVWSKMEPTDCACLGFAVVPNGWWQLGGVGLLTALALFCGWLQGYFGWTPEEVAIEPPAGDHGHEHGHGHH